MIVGWRFEVVEDEEGEKELDRGVSGHCRRNNDSSLTHCNLRAPADPSFQILARSFPVSSWGNLHNGNPRRTPPPSHFHSDDGLDHERWYEKHGHHLDQSGADPVQGQILFFHRSRHESRYFVDDLSRCDECRAEDADGNGRPAGEPVTDFKDEDGKCTQNSIRW